MDFFNEPSSWSVIIAGVALIVTLLPQIRDLIKGTEVSISIPEQISLWHFLGKIQLITLVDIANIGGRRVSISKLESILVDANDKAWLLPAQSYIARQAQPQPNSTPPEYLMTRISLKPSDNWGETVRFNKLWTESEDEEINDIVSSIRNNIEGQLPSDTWVEASPELVTRAMLFFERKFDLHKGNYKLIIVAKTDDERIIGIRGFEFTIFESQIRTLTSHTEVYKYGAGIYYPANDPRFQAWVRVRPMSDKKQVKEMYSKYKVK